MKPTAIYFPFTYISKDTALSMNACFGKTVVCQPTLQNTPETIKALEKQDIIEIRYPFQADDDKITAICREYKNYADLFDRDGLSSLKSQSNEIPFFNSSSTHKLRDQIQGYLNEHTVQKASPGMISRVFLQLAQEFDGMQDEMERKLQTIEIREKGLLSQLKGETADMPAQGKGSEDAGGYLTRDRMTSWANLMQNDPDLPGVFLTHSQAVWNFLSDLFPDAEILIDQKELLVDPDHAADNNLKFREYIHDILRQPRPQNDKETPTLPSAATGKKLCLSLLIVPQKTPYECFAHLLKGTEGERRNETPEIVNQHTLFALVTPV